MLEKKMYPDDIELDFSNRKPLANDLDQVLLERFSTRAFIPTELSTETLKTLFDAARQAPSCFNEQPWRFYCSSKDSFEQYLEFLVAANVEWAKNSSVITVVTAEKAFNHNGKANAHSWFDTGAAWFSLAYQARLMGLYTHAMAGINVEKIATVLQLPDSQEVICAIAIGVIDPDGAANEEVTQRKPLDEILFIS